MELDMPRLARPDHLFLPTYCKICKLLFIIDRATSGIACVERIVEPTPKVEVKIPELPIDTPVYIANKEHPLFLEQGTIIQKDHVHYRIKFISTDKKIHDSALWVPDHWVKELPAGMRKP